MDPVLPGQDILLLELPVLRNDLAKGIEMRLKVALILLILSSLLLSSCGKSSAGTLDDSYHAGTDFQFFQIADGGGIFPRLQETENGCVFLHNDFIYTYDQQSGVIMPLCSRVNCLHDKEMDSEKREDCNAYLDHNLGLSTQLMLFKNNIYVSYTRNDTTPETPYISVLYRISLDGLAKDEIYRTTMIHAPIIHRGFMYYYTQAYEVQKGEEIGSISSTLELHRLNIEGSKVKEEVLLSSDEYTALQAIRAYGNHIYIRLVANNSIVKGFIYDVKTGKIEDFDRLSVLTFCFGQMYATEQDISSESMEQTDVYVCDYLNKESELVLNHFPRYSYITSDLKYLYVNNGYSLFEDPGAEVWFKVYDESMTLVDEFTLPETMKDVLYYPQEPPIGGEKYQYLVFEDAEENEETGTKEVREWGLYVWDKSSIGTLHGKPYEQTKIVYNQDAVPVVSQEEESSLPEREEEITDEYEAELSEWTEDYVEYNPNEVLCKLDLSDAEVTAEIRTEEKSEKQIELYGWYIQGESVRVLHLTSKGTSTEPYAAVLKLPEGAERFIGAKMNYEVNIPRIEIDAGGHEKQYEDKMNGLAYKGRIRKK